MDPLEELRRKDKWYLGGGKSLLWAPPFPAYLDWPGFWDEAHYLDESFERAFTVAFLDERRRAIPLRLLSRDWRPSELTTAWMAGDLLVSERKAVLPQDALISEITVWNPTAAAHKVYPVLYSLQHTSASGTDAISDVTVEGGAIRYVRRRKSGLGSDQRVTSRKVTLGADRPPASFGVHLSDWNSFRPEWELTPFSDRMIAGGLGDQVQVGAPEDEGAVYFGLQYELELAPESRVRLAAGCAIGGELGQLLLQPVELSQQAWAEYFAGLPQLSVSDEHLQRYWWYRWYGLRLNAISNPDHLARHPFVAEGIGQFRNHISYSAQCHVLECRWLPSLETARGSLLNFVEQQGENGAFPANIYSGAANRNGIYHANWGWVLRHLHAVEPDPAFLSTVYPALVRYAEYFQRERDTENVHLYDVLNQGETGQEYMSRYQAVDPKADLWGAIRLKGVDVTVYVYELQRTLSWAAGLLGQNGDAGHWKSEADATKRAVLDTMWDPEQELFSDVDPGSGSRTGVKAAVCFYPFMTDIAGRIHLGALTRHLLNPAEFWTEYPAPASSADDAYFSPWAEWKGKRLSCPWNGRVWPMTNSHLCEALARASQTLDPNLKPRAAELIQRFVRMMFFDGDASRPNCFEHYNPFTGQPSSYRGIDDYQHSWVVDLLIRYLAGIQPTLNDTLLIDPLPFEVESFQMDGVRVRGRVLAVRWNTASGFEVFLDGRKVHEAADRTRLELRVG